MDFFCALLDTLEQLTETYGFGTTRDGVERLEENDGIFFCICGPSLCSFLIIPHLQTAKRIMYTIIAYWHIKLEEYYFSFHPILFFI